MYNLLTRVLKSRELYVTVQENKAEGEGRMGSQGDLKFEENLKCCSHFEDGQGHRRGKQVTARNRSNLWQGNRPSVLQLHRVCQPPGWTWGPILF